MDDSALVRQVLGGNRNAYKFLVIRYQKPLFKFLSAFGLPATVVDEVAQDSFLKAYKNLARFDPTKSVFSSWLFTIAKNSGLNELGRAKTRGAASIKLIDTASYNSTDPHAVYENNETAVRIRNALQCIPESFRSAVALSYLNELSLEEIATIEQCAIGTIKSRIFRGKELLKPLLAGLESRK